MHSLELYHSPIQRQNLFSFPSRWCGALWLSWWIYYGKGDASRFLILRHKRCIFHLAPFHSVLVLRIQPPCCRQALDLWRGHLQVFWLIVPAKVLLSSQYPSPEGWMWLSLEIILVLRFQVAHPDTMWIREDPFSLSPIQIADLRTK